MPSTGCSFGSVNPGNPAQEADSRRRVHDAAGGGTVYDAASVPPASGRSRALRLGAPAPKKSPTAVSLEEVERLFAKQQRELTKAFERSITALKDYVRHLVSKENLLPTENVARDSEAAHPHPKDGDGDRYVRFKELRTITGLARSTVWRAEKRGLFPPRRKISSRSVGWLRTEVDRWVQERRQVGGGDGGVGDGR